MWNIINDLLSIEWVRWLEVVIVLLPIAITIVAVGFGMVCISSSNPKTQAKADKTIGIVVKAIRFLPFVLISFFPFSVVSILPMLVEASRYNHSQEDWKSYVIFLSLLAYWSNGAVNAIMPEKND